MIAHRGLYLNYSRSPASIHGVTATSRASEYVLLNPFSPLWTRMCRSGSDLLHSLLFSPFPYHKTLLLPCPFLNPKSAALSELYSPTKIQGFPYSYKFSCASYSASATLDQPHIFTSILFCLLHWFPPPRPVQLEVTPAVLGNLLNTIKLDKIKNVCFADAVNFYFYLWHQLPTTAELEHF